MFENAPEELLKLIFNEIMPKDLIDEETLNKLVIEIKVQLQILKPLEELSFPNDNLKGLNP